MDFGVVLNGVKQVIKRIARASLRESTEQPFGFVDGLAMNSVADGISACASFGEWRGFHNAKDFIFATAFFLNAIRVAIQDFKYRQWLHGFGQFPRHME